jgi:hypothetical protein
MNFAPHARSHVAGSLPFGFMSATARVVHLFRNAESVPAFPPALPSESFPTAGDFYGAAFAVRRSRLSGVHIRRTGTFFDRSCHHVASCGPAAWWQGRCLYVDRLTAWID